MPKSKFYDPESTQHKGLWEVAQEELFTIRDLLRFGVSREAVLRRLLTLGKTTQTFYESRRAQFLKEYAELNETKSEGGPLYHIQVLSQLGRAFTRLIFQGYHERALTLRDVSNHFNMQVKLIPAMEKAAYGLKS